MTSSAARCSGPFYGDPGLSRSLGPSRAVLHIIVKKRQTSRRFVLEGVVDNETDKNLAKLAGPTAGYQCVSVGEKNNLVVAGGKTARIFRQANNARSSRETASRFGPAPGRLGGRGRRPLALPRDSPRVLSAIHESRLGWFVCLAIVPLATRDAIPQDISTVVKDGGAEAPPHPSKYLLHHPRRIPTASNSVPSSGDEAL